MLLTITPNPTIDRTLHIPRLRVGAVHRAGNVYVSAGGKGLNVARAAEVLGRDALVTGLLAGRAGKTVADLATAEGLKTEWHWLSRDETRTCLLINHDRGDATVINEQGPTVSETDWQSFTNHVQQLAEKSQVIAFSGSVPLGVKPGSLRKLAYSLVTNERAVYVDTSSAALAAVLDQPAGLCIKVNHSELSAGLGLKNDDQSLDQVVKAGRLLLDRGAQLVVVTLGQQGAVAIKSRELWQVRVPRVPVVSTVGSGDSMLAGLVTARMIGRPLHQALAYGVACGTANVLTELPGRFNRMDVEDLLQRVDVTKI